MKIIPHIFISYRREISKISSGRLYEYLESKYGEGRIFKDIIDIPSGEKFMHKISEAISVANIFIVIIEGDFARTFQEREEENDYVLVEIAQALEKEKNNQLAIIPILIDNTEFPPKNILPPKINTLALFNAHRLRADSWRDDCRNLEVSINLAIERLLKSNQNAPKTTFYEIDEHNAVLVDHRDEQKYPVIKLLDNWWLAENYKYYILGSKYYDNDNEYAEKHGRLYTWELALEVCPEGWRLPTQIEWTEILRQFGAELLAKGNSGLNLGLSGYFSPNRNFVELAARGYYWGGPNEDEHSWYFCIEKDGLFSENAGDPKHYARSVRYVKYNRSIELD